MITEGNNVEASVMKVEKKESKLKKEHRHKGRDLGVDAPVLLTAKQEQRLSKLGVI